MGTVALYPRKSPNNQTENQNTPETRSPRNWTDLYRLQSEELSASDINVRTQENLKFVDSGLSEVRTAPSLGPFQPDSDDGAPLASFLSRPVQINSFTWSETNTAINQLTFNPWNLYFNDPGIKKKLDNYARLRCKLHLKFVVNASPFYYGLMRACYAPMIGHDTYVGANDQIKFSQMPGVYLEPAAMTTAEMELPFFYPNAWLDATTGAEFTEMGRMTYMLYSRLRSANGVANASVRIICYAWATDVEVAGLTTLPALQSDEYATPGPISGPASAIAEFAGTLSQAPVIGKLATATEIGARAVGSIARAFGFSNPPVISDVMPYAPKAFHSFSSVDTSVPADKLSLDPKNEITVDNSVTGYSEEDQLAISSIVKRESFVQGTLWNGTAAENTILWSCPVTPMIVAQNTAGGQTTVNHTPASYVGRAFKQWRGSLTYRFKLVKSKYHTGRLIITWDPVITPGVDYETTTLTRVVDLQTEEEVVLTIPYKSQRAWCTTDFSVNNYSNGANPSFAIQPLAQNGVLQVRVLTTLTGPAATSEIDILSYVSCGDDFCFSMPNELPSGLSMYALQSQEVSIGDVVSSDFISDAVSGDSAKHLELITVGESVKSLRALLHRASLADFQFAGEPRFDGTVYQSLAYRWCTNYFPRVPLGYGYNPAAYQWATRPIATGNAPFNFGGQHPLNWFLNMYAGYRGSVVHHFNVDPNGATVPSIAVERDDRNWLLFPGNNGRNRYVVNTNLSQSSTASAVGSSNYTAANVRATPSGQRGMALTNAATQAGVSIVLPQYSQFRFLPAIETNRDFVRATWFPMSVRSTVTTRCGDATSTGPWPTLHHYVSAGVDFSPVFFVCVPTLYAYGGTAVDNFTP